MITWLTVDMLVLLYYMVQSASKVSSTYEKVAATVAVTMFVIPTIYAVGWLLLPAWGVGAIKFGG